MNKKNIDILVLAGGKAQRLGGDDKGLTLLNEKPLIEHCISRLPTHCDNLIISANRNHARYSTYAKTVVSDKYGLFEGPLAGIVSALSNTKHDHLLVVPCDMPFLPIDLYDRLANKIAKKQLCAVIHANQIEPLLLLVKKAHIASITQYLASGRRSVIGWLKESDCNYVKYDHNKISFLNINTQHDIALAQELINNSASTKEKSPSADPQHLLLTPVLQ